MFDLGSLSESTAITLVVVLGAIVIALFAYSARQKRRFEDERRERRRKLDAIKAEARAKAAARPSE